MTVTQPTIVVLTNVPNEDVANRLALALVNAHEAACVNILARCQSVYRWGGTAERTEEFPLLIKTTADRYAAVERTIRSLHPYTVPEIIALPIATGFAGYLGWVVSETREPTRA